MDKKFVSKRKRHDIHDIHDTHDITNLIRNHFQTMPLDQLILLISSLPTQDIIMLAQSNKRLYELISKNLTLIGSYQNPSVDKKEAICEVAFKGGLTCDQFDHSLRFLNHSVAHCSEYCKERRSPRFVGLRLLTLAENLMRWGAENPKVRLPIFPILPQMPNGQDLKDFAIDLANFNEDYQSFEGKKTLDQEERKKFFQAISELPSEFGRNQGVVLTIHFSPPDGGRWTSGDFEQFFSNIQDPSNPRIIFPAEIETMNSISGFIVQRAPHALQIRWPELPASP